MAPSHLCPLPWSRVVWHCAEQHRQTQEMPQWRQKGPDMAQGGPQACWAPTGITVPSTARPCDRCNVPPSIRPLAHANDCQHGTEAMKGKKITP